MDIELLKKMATLHKGKPYYMRTWGEMEVYDPDPLNFDCSKFVMWLYFHQGYKIPAWTGAQIKFCNKVPLGGLKVGHLIFTGHTKAAASVNHVGVYIGQGLVAHAAGGNADRVVFDFLESFTKKPGFIGVYEVPLGIAEEKFFEYLEKFPPEPCRKK